MEFNQLREYDRINIKTVEITYVNSNRNMTKLCITLFYYKMTVIDKETIFIKQ